MSIFQFFQTWRGISNWRVVPRWTITSFQIILALFICPVAVKGLRLYDIYPSTYVSFRDDDFSSATLSFPFKYFGNIYNSLFINTNGNISFRKGHQNSSTSCTSDVVPIIIVFWGDVKKQESGFFTSTDDYIAYSQTTDPNNGELNRAATEIFRVFPQEGRNLTGLFITTWRNAGKFSDQSLKNTFQAVLASDGVRSFVILNYYRISWQASGPGFIVGDNKTIYMSSTDCKSDPSRTSNVKTRGTWIYQVDMDVRPPYTNCLESRLDGNISGIYPQVVPVQGNVPVIIKVDLCLELVAVSAKITTKCTYFGSGESGSVTVVGRVVPLARAIICPVSQLPSVGHVPFQVTVEVGNRQIISYNKGAFLYAVKDPDDYRVVSRERSSLTGTATENLLDVVIAEQEGLLIEGNMSLAVTKQTISNFVHGLQAIYDMIEGYHQEDWKVAGFNEYDRKCHNWYAKEGEDSLVGVVECPGSVDLARYDWRFMEDTSLLSRTLHPGAATLYRSSVFSTFQSMCTYGDNGVLRTGYPGGSWVYRINNADDSTRVYQNGYSQDILPYLYCCKWSVKKDVNCRHLFFRKRSINTSSAYTPLQYALIAGTGHVTTFDGLSYRFSGCGEYWAMKAEDTNGVLLKMQIRMDRYPAKNVSTVTAAVWQEIESTNSVKVQVSFDNDGGLMVKVGNGTIFPKGDIRATFSGQETFHSRRVIVRVLSEGEVILSFVNGFNFRITVNPTLGATSALNIIASADLSRRMKSVLGLWGKFNGNMQDDFTLPSGIALTTLFRNPTVEKVHTDFGQKWAVITTESVFTLVSGNAYNTYCRADYVPWFVEVSSVEITAPKAVKTECGAVAACMYDYLATGNRSIAWNTKTTMQTFKQILNITSFRVETCDSPNWIPENGHIFGDRKYSANAIIEIRCDDKMRLFFKNGRSSDPDSRYICVRDSYSKGLKWESYNTRKDPEPLACLSSWHSRDFDYTTARSTILTTTPRNVPLEPSTRTTTVRGPTCPPPKAPSHGAIIYQSHRVQVVCDDGYTLINANGRPLHKNGYFTCVILHQNEGWQEWRYLSSGGSMSLVRCVPPEVIAESPDPTRTIANSTPADNNSKDHTLNTDETPNKHVGFDKVTLLIVFAVGLVAAIIVYLVFMRHCRDRLPIIQINNESIRMKHIK